MNIRRITSLCLLAAVLTLLAGPPAAALPQISLTPASEGLEEPWFLGSLAKLFERLWIFAGLGSDMDPDGANGNQVLELGVASARDGSAVAPTAKLGADMDPDG